jgi:large conductance mechanosensitive channel
MEPLFDPEKCGRSHTRVTFEGPCGALASAARRERFHQRQGGEMLKEFKTFILRGNVVDLAVGVVIGAAFGSVITSFVTNILTPLVAIPGKADFSDLKFTIRESDFLYGIFINDVVSFLLIGVGVFFVIVKPVNKLMEMRKTQPDVESPTVQCAECLSNIPAGARRCAFCTSLQGSGARG